MHDEREWQTRKQRIDPRLDALGWRRSPSGKPSAYRTEEHETENGPADYALHLAGEPIGVVEAKKLTVSPNGVLTQCERYSRGLAGVKRRFGEFGVPFLYSTNGEITRFHDVRDQRNLSREVADFHTPSALQEMLSRDFDTDSRALDSLPNDHSRLREYQREANSAIETAIRERKRRMLVAMATGTGKTFMMVNQIYRLMKSGVARRVLFLVDRRALAAQAVRTFAADDAEPGLKFNQVYEVYSQRFQTGDFDADEPFDPKVLPKSYLTDPQPGHAFVYVCTIQRMAINLFGRHVMFEGREGETEDDAHRLDIPIHAFDFVVADECHRGYTSQELSLWRKTLDHFDAIKLGLTATPAAHTTTYFHNVVYRYDYERAVREGFLVDYDVVNIRSNVRMNGVFLEAGEQVGVVDSTSGQHRFDFLEDERKFDSSDIEQKVTAPDSNQKIVAELKNHLLKHEEVYGRFPKTLIFAVNDLPHTSHADQLVDILRESFSRGESFAQKITGRVDRPLQRIREFRNRPDPKIVVSVDLMSTGVDIPDLEFIVFLRPVKSRILFEQMLGRGTRITENLADKSHFTVVDCFDGTLLEYFAKATSITAEEPVKPSRTIVEVISDIWSNRERDYNVRCLVKRLQRIDKEMDPQSRGDFDVFIEQGDLSHYARELPRRLRDDFTETMKLLRNSSFQELLVNYKRPLRTFLVAVETEDEVSSEVLIRQPGNRNVRPVDYLQLFAKFIEENQSQIDALRILLDRPRDWGTQALVELKQKLAQAPARFTEENLRIAHAEQYRKHLVDIISMVKHAAKKEEPLLTAAERVERAFGRVASGKTFTEAQRQWLDRIRDHLVQNLTIDRDDFDSIPVLSRFGGWGAANRAFNQRLKPLLDELNEAIAA